MANAATLERRLATLEKEVAELKQAVFPKDKPDWFEKIAGSFKGDPDFLEILRLGREIRQADRPEDKDSQGS